MFFLSTNGLLIGNKHKGASGKSDAYQVTGAASDPIMQFVGNTFAAHANGAEEIYMPAPDSGVAQHHQGAGDRPEPAGRPQR